MRPASPAIRRRLAQTTAVAALLVAAPAMAQVAPTALPTGESRPELVTRDGAAMTVTLNPLAPRSVINWRTYDIGANASVHYTNLANVDVVPTAVLNRVVGTSNEGQPTRIIASNILGKLTSENNISVFLVNQAGILFGQNATVSVGSLIASTRDINERALLSARTDSYNFTGTSDTPDLDQLQLIGDRKIVAGSTDPLGFSANGIVALIAARVETRGTINAGRELAIIAADDTTLTFTPGSPLQITISAGTSITTPMLLRGTLNGGTVVVAAATRNDITGGLLDIDATMTATSARASDGGIKLVGGHTDELAAQIAMPTEVPDGRGGVEPAQNSGEVAIRLGGALTATVRAGAIDIRARNGVEAQPGAAGRATLFADQGVLVRAETGNVVLGDVTGKLRSSGADGVDILASAGAISLRAVAAGTPASANPGSAGAGASIVASGQVDVSSLFAARDATISGTAVNVGTVARSEAGALTVTASDGNILADTLRSAGLLQVTTESGTVGVGSLVSDADSVQVGAAAVRGRAVGALASIDAAQDATVDVGGAAAFGTVDARRIQLIAGGALTANRLTSTLTSSSDSGVYASGGTLDVGIADAPGASTLLYAGDGDAAVTSLKAGVDGFLSASGRAVVRGGGVVGRDLYVIGESVLLGGVPGGGTVQVGQNAYFEATDGAITGAAPATGLTIRGDADGTGSGSIVLSAVSGIDLGGVALVTGDPLDTRNTGDIGISLANASAPLVLGQIDARSLQSVEIGEGYTFSPLTTTGAVTLGDTHLVRGLALSTGEAIRLGLVAISGAGETLSVTGTGLTNTITASGDLSAPGGVTVSAPGAVSLAGVASSGGPVTIASTGAALTAGGLSGTTVYARARDALLLGSVAADAGAAELVSTTGGITVTGATVATGDVTVSAPGAIRMAAVTSSGGTILFQPADVTGTGAIVAGAVSARSGLTVARDAGITFDSATSQTGAVSLLSTNGIVRVDGPTTAAGSVALGGTALVLGSVTAGTTATLTASTGTIRASGAIGAGGTVTLTAPGAIDVRDVTSDNGTIVFGPSGAAGAVSAGAVSAAGDLDVARAAGVSFASATSRAGSVSLRSSSGAIAVSGATTAATGVLISGTSATLGTVTANGGAIDLAANAGTLGTGALFATGAITGLASGNAAIGGSVSSGGRVELLSGAGRVDVTGPITARDFVTVLAETGVGLAGVTDTGAAASRLLARNGAVVVTGATSVGGPLSVEGATGVTLDAVQSTGGAVTLASSAGGVLVDGALRGRGAVGVSAQGAVSLQGVRSDTAAVTIASVDGVVGATTIDAATDVAASGQGTVTLGRVDAGGGTLLRSRAGGVSVGQVTTGTTLSADAASTLAITTGTVGAAATLIARDVTLGTLGAGTLSATANGGDLRLTAGDVRGAATLTKTGTAGEIAIGRLTAAGPTRITSTGAVRADRLEGGATTVSAAGSVSGLTGGLAANVASLAITAGGNASFAGVTTAGDFGVAATGAALLAGAIGTGGDLVASGSSVTLGSGVALTQVAGGRIGVTSTGGAITGLAGLTLRSDAGGMGGRDLTLQSSQDIAFAPATLVAGGPDRQSVVRLAAGASQAIVLGAVEARTIASPGTGTALSHQGPLSIDRVATRDSLAITLGGVANPLTLGPVEVRAGDLSLDASGALSVGAITANAGTTTLAGSSVTSGAIATRAVQAVARSGAATIATIDATAGGVAATAATDLRLTRATATGDIALASTAGDITGTAASGGFASAVLASSGGAVRVRADATDGIRGVVLLDTVAAAGGIDLAGRTIGATSLVAGGAVTASTARDAAAITDGRMRIGTIDASGPIALATGNRAVASDGSLTVDRASSSGGGIAITTLGGGLSARSGSPATILSAPAGAIALTIGGPAIVGSATARSTAITATTLTAGTTTASAGPLTLTASSGPLTLGTGSASGAATLSAAGALMATTLTAGTTALSAGTDLIVDRITSAGVVTATAGQDATITTVTAGGDTALTATRALAVQTVSTPGTLNATAGSGGIRLGTATVSGAATVRSGAGAVLGTLDAGAIDLRATGPLSADTLVSRAGIVATAASAAVGQASARGGDLALTASSGDVRLETATASGSVALASSGTTTVSGAVSAGGGYRIDAAAITLGTAGAPTRQAAADVALVARTGSVTALGSTTLAATRGLAVTANGSAGAIGFAPETTITSAAGDVALATRGIAALGTVAATGGAIRLDAADAALTGLLTAQAVTLTNVATAGVTRLGNAAAGNEAEFGAGATRFDLTNAEVGLISAPTVTIASGGRDVVVGALGLAPTTGSTRFAITATGRIDMLGRFVAAGSTASRTIAIGTDATGTRTGTIRVAATPTEGGRLLVDGAALELAADRIGVGYDRDFLDAIGYRTATGLGVEAVTREYVARPTSTLYNASGLGAQPYSDGVLVRSGTLALTYGRYALIQNTGRPGEQRGVVIGTAGAVGSGNDPTLRLSAPGSSSNTFALFGTIEGISSSAAALLGPDRVQIGPDISPVASRVNGCVIGSGAGCLNTSIAQPALNLFDTSRAEIVRTADDLTLPFDPLIGTNNEALYLDPATDETPPDCEGDKPCPTKP